MRGSPRAPLARAAFLVALLAAGCARRVEYGDPAAQETLTADFGSTDLQMIAQKMVESLLASPVVQEGSPPVVQVSRFRNKTDEHIDAVAITDKIRTALFQSGRVRFVAGEVREEVIRELEYQRGSGYVDETTRRRIGKMVGAEYLLMGEITSIRKKAGRQTDLYFLVTLNLVDLQTALIPWAEQKEIRKVATRPLLGW
ncbi:MAG: penicillin-binding protein activator LpoB [bacterium]